jgi:hypothetical protein
MRAGTTWFSEQRLRWVLSAYVLALAARPCSDSGPGGNHE